MFGTIRTTLAATAPWLALACSLSSLSATDLRDRFEARMYRGPQGGQLPYRLLKPPQYDPKKQYPLVLFFHGAGERGDDNQKQLVHGMSDFASDAIRDKYPCFVIAPQCPQDLQWVDTPWTADRHVMPEQPTPPMRRALQLVRQMQREFSIDRQRIYVTGLSMGGFGTWDAIQRRPQLFAAAVPICGGGDTALAKRIAHIPIWAFHGARDTVVKPKRSRDMIQAIRAAGGSPKYTEYPDAEHNSWAATYAQVELYQWLFAQRRKVTEPPPRLQDALHLDPFYRKYVDAEGLPILGSQRVQDHALLEAAYLVNLMLADRSDIRAALIRNQTRCVVMASSELTTDVPEHSDLRPKQFWDRRARGLGATPQRPAVSCGEENLLGLAGDPYASENILIHEFAHTIHHMGLNYLDGQFDRKLQRAYENARHNGLWDGKYASRNPSEYWAEGVQSWFDTNRPPDHDHNHVDTREELKQYDPQLARLIGEVFGPSDWRYQRPQKRADKAHLVDLDIGRAPTFSWPPELVQWYQRHRRQQRARAAASSASAATAEEDR